MAMNRMEARCQRCRSWQLLDGQSNVGECRISPPIVLPSFRSDALLRVFPPTHGDDWCDQFQSQSRLRIPTEFRKDRRARREAEALQGPTQPDEIVIPSFTPAE